MNSYEDFLNLPHYEPKNHPRMSIENRSSQFAPFSALSGYKDAIKEKERLTEKMIHLSNEEQELLNKKLLIIQNNLSNQPIITFTYFIGDKLKDGGKYITKNGIIKKMDLIKKEIKLIDGTIIPLYNLLKITSDMLKLDEI